MARGKDRKDKSGRVREGIYEWRKTGGVSLLWEIILCLPSKSWMNGDMFGAAQNSVHLKITLSQTQKNYLTSNTSDSVLAACCSMLIVCMCRVPLCILSSVWVFLCVFVCVCRTCFDFYMISSALLLIAKFCKKDVVCKSCRMFRLWA